MNNEEMSLTILNRMDSMETSLNGRMDNLETGLIGLNDRMDNVETGLTGLNGRMDKLESDMNMEFYAVRKEMDEVYKFAKKQSDELNSKLDRLMFTKDVEGYEKMNIRIEVLERGYQKLMGINA